MTDCSTQTVTGHFIIIEEAHCRMTGFRDLSLSCGRIRSNRANRSRSWLFFQGVTGVVSKGAWPCGKGRRMTL